jgi:hypothetical protein
MNRILNKITVLAAALVLAGCQKDDLCTADQSSSPRMVVVFKDATNPSIVKTAPNLRIKEIGSSEFAPLNFEGATLLTEADTIYLPLRSLNTLTSYNFYTEEDGVINIDNIDFRYLTKDVYVSRACGFKTDYENLTLLRTEENPSNLWITGAVVISNTVNNSNEVHVEIRH